MSTTSMFRSLAEMRAFTDAEIEERIDGQLQGGHVMMTITFLRDELARRESGRREEAILRLTRRIEQLTWVVTAATIGALVIALTALVAG